MKEALTLNEALDMIEYQRGVIADMAGHNEPNVPGFTKSQSRILRCLQSANGRVISRGGLMSALYYDMPEEPSDCIIPVVICHIRAKLRFASCSISAQIVNVWGEGFRLVPA